MGGINEKVPLDAKASKAEEEEDLLVVEEEQGLIPGLPPPSTDSNKWWLDNGNLARSLLKPPGPDYISNPNKPSNPFDVNIEPDWVKIDLTGASTSSISFRRNGHPMPPQRSALPTSVPQLATNPNNSAELSTMHKNLPRKRLPPPFNPGTLQTPLSGVNTLCASSSTQISSMPDAPMKKKILAPPPPISHYPQHADNSTTINTTTTMNTTMTTTVDSSTQTPSGTVATPTRKSSSTENHRSQPQQPSVTLNSQLTPPPSNPKAVIPSTGQKPPVPKKPIVLAKPAPSPVTPVPNRLSKQPPPLPTSTPNPASMFSSDPTTTSSNTFTKLKKPLPETKLPTSALQSLSSQTPVSTPPPPPMWTAMTTTLAANQAISPPQTRPKHTIALAMDAEVGQEGVESNSQITDVKKGVAQWESLAST